MVIYNIYGYIYDIYGYIYMLDSGRVGMFQKISRMFYPSNKKSS